MTVRTIETFDISDERPSVFLRAWEDFKENGISTPALKLFLLCVKYLLPSKARAKLLGALMPLRPESMADRPTIERAIYLHLVHDLPVAVGMAPGKWARRRGPLIMLALTPFRILNAIVLGTGAILNTAIRAAWRCLFQHPFIILQNIWASLYSPFVMWNTMRSFDAMLAKDPDAPRDATIRHIMKHQDLPEFMARRQYEKLVRGAMQDAQEAQRKKKEEPND